MRKDARYPSEMLDHFSLRMKPALNAAIKKAAKENGRSVNAEINLVLEHAFGLEQTSPAIERLDDAEMLDRIALALLPDTVRGMHGVRYDDKPKKAIRDAYHTAKLLMAARAEYLSQQPDT